jgi:hypothetical protein
MYAFEAKEAPLGPVPRFLQTLSMPSPCLSRPSSASPISRVPSFKKKKKLYEMFYE